MSSSNIHLVIVGFGHLVPYKYLACIFDEIRDGNIDSYSIIELESKREQLEVQTREFEFKPIEKFYIPSSEPQTYPNKPYIFEPFFKKLSQKYKKLKVFIATEARSHENYLRYCVENGIDSLVEKPVITPTQNGKFAPELIEPKMSSLIELTKNKKANHSVMTLGRYHPLYNDMMYVALLKKMLEHNTPLTSVHIRTGSGVWNLLSEYQSREDHPYKYGYGMLMHGAYHYIDLLAQFLSLNNKVFPEKTFSLSLSSFAAYPFDQPERMSEKINITDDHRPNWTFDSSKKVEFGETDITTTFCLKNTANGKTVTMGTISLEQTTPSIRNWKNLPADTYNKNGRIPCTDIEVQLSTLFSMHARYLKVPFYDDKNVLKYKKVGYLSTRSNALLLKEKDFYSHKYLENISTTQSNLHLLQAWLRGKEERSQLVSHFKSMHLTQAIALSLRNQGTAITIDWRK